MLEKLREARDAMSSKFPLSPGMWQEWTSDEARLISRYFKGFQWLFLGVCFLNCNFCFETKFLPLIECLYEAGFVFERIFILVVS